jgi:hypothetical protein
MRFQQAAWKRTIDALTEDEDRPWYRFGTDQYVQCVQIVQNRGRIRRSGRSRLKAFGL